MSDLKPTKKTAQIPQKSAKNPMMVQLDFGIKFLRFHLELSLDENYLERRRNETLRSKCSNNAGPRHS